MRKGFFILFVMISNLLFSSGIMAEDLPNTWPSDVAVVGIQLRIDEEMYESLEAFSQAIEIPIRNALSTSKARDQHHLLLVFPEYTSAFLALIPYYEYVRRSGSVSEALAKIMAADRRIDSVQSLFAVNSSRVEEAMDYVWGGLARAYGVTLVAGTRFVLDEGELRNALVIYGPDGERRYEQDKVYLTDFEVDIVGLSPGSVNAALPFELGGFGIAFTVCRDTFFAAWDEKFAGAEYWIDIKANGTEFDAEESARFQRALPVRIAESDPTRGMTVCLTGMFLDLFWQGRSFTVFQDAERVHVGEVAQTYKGDAALWDILVHRTANRDAK